MIKQIHTFLFAACLAVLSSCYPALVSALPKGSPKDQQDTAWLSITIGSGDSLSSLFAKHGLSQGDLMELLEANRSSQRLLDNLSPGQELKIQRNGDKSVTTLRLTLTNGEELILGKGGTILPIELSEVEPLGTTEEHIDIEAEEEDIAAAEVEDIVASDAEEEENIAEVQPDEAWVSITITSGDTLSSLFQKHGLPQGDLMELLAANKNGKRLLHSLSPGQKLKIQRDNQQGVLALRLSLQDGKKLILDKVLNGGNKNHWSLSIQNENGKLESLPSKPGNIGSQVADYSLTKKSRVKRSKATQKSDWLHFDDSRIDTLLSSARSLLGSPYRYGGTTPRGFDCSGFVMYNMKKIGVKVPRTAQAQYAYTRTNPVSRANLRAGDLVFFYDHYNRRRIGHVGIYLGNDRFIHAVSTNNPVAITSLSKSYYSKRFAGGGRLFG